jgi:hypothetical protein
MLLDKVFSVPEHAGTIMLTQVNFGRDPWQIPGPGSTPGDTPRILARSVSEGNPDPRLRFGLV